MNNQPINLSVHSHDVQDAHTIFEFSVEELKLLAINVAKEYCKLKKDELAQAAN